MSDETIITNNEPVTTTETDSIPNQEVNTEQVDQETTQENTENTQETTTENQEITLPEKIKLGEKEYTPAELEEITKQAETQRAEQAKNEYQPRELNVIEEDINKTYKSLEADAALLQKNYLAKADTPLVNVQDAEGNIVQEPAFYTPDQAYQHGLKTGEWDYFIACLSPQDAVAFQNERMQLAQDYNPKFKYLNEEKDYISTQSAKKEDLGKWDSYIETNFKDKPGEKYLLDKIKTNFGFDENGVKNFIQWYQEAKALENNVAQLGIENDTAKQKMMGSSINGNNGNVGKDHIFTRAEIGKMSSKQFAKYEKQIDEQYAKGLIK